MGIEVPIAFCIFNRPDLTRQVFESIRQQKPKRLFVIGDGPRKDQVGEAQRVKQAREIATQIDWDCQLETNFCEYNLGCRQRMASGITWAFQRSEQLIILEDDCLPDPSFFSFCSELLSRFANTPEVMMISGDNFQPQRRSPYSYYFSQWAHIWGWASWRRAWEQYDLSLSNWPQERSSQILEFDSPQQQAYWQNVFDQVHERQVDTWDFSWQYTICKSKGLVVLPESNLVSNLGFGNDATHTHDPESILSRMPTSSLGELRHPAGLERNQLADRWTFENIFNPVSQQSQPKRKPWWNRVFRRAS